MKMPRGQQECDAIKSPTILLYKHKWPNIKEINPYCTILHLCGENQVLKQGGEMCRRPFLLQAWSVWGISYILI